MAMRCFVCGKKLNIFSDYTQIEVNGVKKEICTPCNRKREKQEIKQLLLTDQGKREVDQKANRLMVIGIFECFFGIFFILIFRSLLGLLSLILCGFGIFSIVKGLLYKHKSRSSG